LKLLFDENLSPRLVELLAADFPGCTHIEILGMRGVCRRSPGPQRRRAGDSLLQLAKRDPVPHLAAPEMKSRIVEQGFMPVTMDVGETEKFVSADVERWGKIIRDGNIKAE